MKSRSSHGTIKRRVVAATNLLQPYLPIIASKIAEKVGEEIPSTVNNLWEAIRKHFSRKPSAQETLIDLLKNPDDSDLQAAFRVQFRKLIEEDDEFAKIIKDITGNLEEQPRYFSRQNGTGNISIQGKGNIFTQHQSGGITANNVVVNNISTNPAPALQIKEIFINQPHEGKFHSRFKLSLLTPYPIGNLYIGVRASKIESMEVAPMRAGGFMSGPAGNRDGYAFDNLHNAYGNYELRIITEVPEKFVIEYNIE